MPKRRMYELAVIALRSLVCLVMGVTGPLAQGNHSGTHSWNVGEGGSYYVTGNWDPTGVPGVGDVALFGRSWDDDGADTITFPDIFVPGFPEGTFVERPDPVSDRLVVRWDHIELDLWGAASGARTYTLGSSGDPESAASLLLGQGSFLSMVGNRGSLQITGGGTLAGVDAVLGLDSGTVFSGFGRWRSRGDLTITESSSVVLSRDMFIGYGGDGALHVDAGGSVEAAGTTYLGYGTFSMGEAVITEGGAQWNAQAMQIGRAGQGAVALEGGALITSGATSLGHQSTGDGAASIRDGGSLWEVGGAFTVGFSGDGELTIETGGELTVSNVSRLAATSGSTASVIVTGAGSRWRTESSLDVAGHALGSGGQATLTIEEGAAVEVGGTMRVWPGGVVNLDRAGSLDVGGFENRGSLSFDDGTLTVRGGTFQPSATPQDFRIDGAFGLLDEPTLRLLDGAATAQIQTLSIGEAERGALEVRQGSTLNASNLYLAGTANASGGTGTLSITEEARVEVAGEMKLWHDGTLTGDGTVQALQLINRGMIDPVGTIDLEGSYTQHNSGSLAIAMGAMGHDRLVVTGAASLAGTLMLEQMPGEAAPAWQEMEIISAASVSGEFDSVVAPGLNHIVFQLQYMPNRVLLTAGRLGDMNLDGVVDTGDVAPFVLALTDPEAYMAQHGVDEATMITLGDINQDGAFDTGDVAPFVQLLVGGGSQSVPEPGSLALLGLGGLLLLLRHVA